MVVVSDSRANTHRTSVAIFVQTILDPRSRATTHIMPTPVGGKALAQVQQGVKKLMRHAKENEAGLDAFQLLEEAEDLVIRLCKVVSDIDKARVARMINEQIRYPVRPRMKIRRMKHHISSEGTLEASEASSSTAM